MESVEQSHFREHLKAIEFDKGKNLLVKDLFVLAGDKVAWEDLSDELSQEISHLAVLALSVVKLCENSASCLATFGSFLEKVLLALLPIFRHRAVLAQVVIVVKLLLILDHLGHHLDQRLFDRFAHSAETQHVLDYFVRNLFSRHLRVEDVLLEEGVLSVHVSTVEKSVSIDDLVPVVANVLCVIILLILDVKFVTGDVLPGRLFRCG